MRILSEKARNELTIIDKLAGNEKHTLYYRMPTPDERQAYEHAKIRREGDEVEINATEAAFDAGTKILTGIGEDCFGRINEAGLAEPISSDEKSEFYHEKWKDLMKKQASDHIIHLGLFVFENPTVVKPPEKVPEEPGIPVTSS